LAELAHPVAHHFDDAEQQREAGTLGMWIFLVTEIMFFGGMFTAYVVYRTLFPEAFAHASHHLDVRLGTINTAVLIASSLTMALSVHAAQVGRRGAILRWLGLTALLGSTFLVIKSYEYAHKFAEGHVYVNVYTDFQHWYVNLIYLLAMAMLGLHINHGFWSAAQTLGLTNPTRDQAIKATGTFLAVTISVGFMMVPIGVMTGIVK